MGRHKRFTPEELEQKWEEYKNYCDNYKVLVHDFSAKNSEFVSEELNKPITYTILGFCIFIGLDRKAFYDNYAECNKYTHIVTRMREECELDVRRKFETSQLPTQLAGLWMSKHGYSTRSATEISANSDEAVKNFLQAVQPSREELEELYGTPE